MMNKNLTVQPLPISEWSSGIWRIELPFGSGNVNAFLIEDEKLTLIDSGPPYPQTIDLLQKCLKKIGYTWNDIEILILTHPHVDHMGGVAKLSDPPQVYTFEGTKNLIGSYDEYIENLYFTLLERLAEEYPELKNKLITKEAYDWIHSYYCPGGNFTIHKEFSDGQEIDLGKRRLRVLHTPGHHLLHMGLYYEKEKILFSGDYVLRGGPQLTRLLGDDIGAFQNSVNTVKSLDINRIFPSHGKEVDPIKGIAHIENLVQKQIKKVTEALKDGEKTAQNLFETYYKKIPDEMMGVYFAGLDTYLNVLIKQGQVMKKDNMYYLC
jgi:glyoxylase-like metal-dependent hydrolase (beta-lactamase superfamily II)